MVSSWSVLSNIHITHQVQLLPVPGYVPHTPAVTIEHTLLTHHQLSDSVMTSGLYLTSLPVSMS